MQPLDVTYTLSGAWGSAVLSATAPGSAAGSFSTHTYDLDVAPTTLQLNGTVVDLGGNPVANTGIYLGNVVGSDQYWADSPLTSTNSSGEFAVTVVLNAGVTEGSVSLELDDLLPGGYGVNYELPFTVAEPGEINTVAYTFREEREIYVDIYGDAVIDIPPDTYIDTYWLDGSFFQAAIDGSEVCEDTVSNTSYSCYGDISFTDEAPVTIDYDLAGDWGSSTASETFDPQDATPDSYGSGSSWCNDSDCVYTTSYYHSLEPALTVAPTLLHLTGTIFDSSNQPAAYAEIIQVEPDGFFLYDEWPYAEADANGVYDLYVIIGDGIASGSLTYHVYYPDADVTEMFTRSFSDIVAGTTNEVNHDLSSGTITGPVEFEAATVVGPDSTGFAGSGSIRGLAVTSDGTTYYSRDNGIYWVDGEGTVQKLSYSPNQIITGMAMDATDSYVFTGVWHHDSAEVRQISLADGSYSIVANGLNLPTRVALDHDRNLLYFSEMNAGHVKQIDLDTNVTTIIASISNEISHVTVGPDGSVYLMNRDAPQVVKVPREGGTLGTPYTVAGDGTQCTGICGDGGDALDASFAFSHHHGLAIGPDGSIYIADTGNHRIRRVDPVTNEIATVAGGGTSAPDDSSSVPATEIALNSPTNIHITDDGTLYVVDEGNTRVRMLTPLP
jgi:sugar lactone lactonase YvrE